MLELIAARLKAVYTQPGLDSQASDTVARFIKAPAVRRHQSRVFC